MTTRVFLLLPVSYWWNHCLFYRFANKGEDNQWSSFYFLNLNVKYSMAKNPNTILIQYLHYGEDCVLSYVEERHWLVSLLTFLLIFIQICRLNLCSYQWKSAIITRADDISTKIHVIRYVERDWNTNMFKVCHKSWETLRRRCERHIQNLEMIIFLAS